MNIIAQVFGFIALIFYVISLQKNNKKKILFLMIIANVFYALQYLMLDAYAALFVSLIGIFRSIIFLKFEQEKKDIPLYVLLIIFGIVLYSGFLSYNGALSLIPLSLSLIYSWSLWQKNMKIFRKICVLNACCWIFYNFIVGAYVGAVASMIEFIFSIASIVKFDIKHSKKESK